MSSSALMLSLADPWESRDGGTLRNRATEEYLRRAGFAIELAFPSAPLSGVVGAERPIARNLRAVKRRYLPMPTAVGAKDEVLRERVAASQADLLHISALSQAPYREHADARLWLDFMDLWSSFALREASTRRWLAKGTARAQAAWLARQEVRACDDAWLVTAAGWADRQTLLERGVDAVWLPTTLPDDEFALVERVGPPGRVAGFLGNFNYWPNRDAYDSLIKNWLPQLRSMGWTVVVAGMGSDSLAAPPAGVQILGPVDELDEFYSRIDATLAPIALGGGIKVKVIESLAKGVPVVGTEFAFDGFPDDYHDMFMKVNLESPSFVGLDELKRVDPAGERLRVFRESDASRRVADLLSEAQVREGERK